MKTLEELESVLGSDRKLTICRELTKRYEEEKKNWESMTLEEHMQVYESQGIARKEAMKLVAKDRGISKRDVYQALLS